MKRAFVAVVIVAAMFVTLGISVGAEAANTDALVPGLASFLIPGLGQLINDEVSKAILHFGVDVAILSGGWYFAMLAYPTYLYSYYFVGLAHLAWSLYSGYDAYNVARERGFSLGLTQEGIALSYQF